MNPNELGSKPFDSQLKTIKLYIYLNNKLILPVDIYPTDTLLDIRQFLSETSQLFFISSYHFEYKGSPLSEFIEISAQKDIDNKARIDIKVDPYDEKSARYHLKKAQELLQHPYSYQNIFGNILRALKDPFLIAQEFKEKEDKFDGRPEEMSIEYWEINQRRFGLNDIIQGKLNDFFEFYSSTKSGNDDLKFVDILTFSNFNPPPTYRKLKGDFFYLTLKTLENNEYTITSCPRGFYINCSTQTTYSPNPQDSKIYYNILDLVCSLSPLCRKNLQKLIDEEVNEDNFYMKPLNLYTSETKWLSSLKDNDVQEYKYDQIRNENFLVDLHGFDPSTIRDWNEELQMCKDLPKQDLIQRLNKDKVLLKIHSDFAEAATKGAKGIIDKYIHPLNPQDDEKQQVFVYNQIFFSLVTQTSDSYTQEKGLEAAPTISISNNDLRNLKILHKLDIPELYLLNTAIIDYKGQRILAQTIIPGILNCEQSQRADFGSVDEGKTVHHNEEFNELMKKVCEYFCLSKEVECLDGNNNIIILAGSPEVKGIRSANRKKFLLDLARLSPRDANWLGKEDEYISCVIRPELISHFVISKNFSVANDYIKQEFGERPAEITQKSHEETQLQTRQPFGKYKSLQEKDLYPKKNPTYSDYINRIQEYLLRHEDKNRFRFNSNIHTRTKLANTDSIEFESQQKDLRDLASFIINHSIPNLIKDLVNGDIILPCESKSLGELFHAHGINMRYIGRVCNSIQKESHAFLHVLLERIMLAKCVKHFLRESLAKMDSAFYAETIAYIFNSIFSPLHIIEKMDSPAAENLPSQNVKNSVPVSESTGIEYESPPLEFSTSQNLQKQLDDLLAQKPQKVWDRLREICNRRYLYELPEKIKDFKPFQHRLTKLATLRDVCISTGIILECKEYNLTNERGGSLRNVDYNLPFKADDIFDMVPILKHLDPACEDAKSQIELANCLVAERKYEEALENLWGSMQIILNIYGPIHKDIAFCYSKIANIYYQLGEINQAIVNHKQSVKILEKFYGFDNAQTAHGYSSLALLHYYAKQYDKAFACLLKSLYIFNIIGGEFHPECAMILNNLALMYQDMEKSQAAINCLFESLDRNILMYQTDSVKVAYVYQHLALAHLDVNDYVKAIDFQKKCLGIMKRSLPVEDMRIKDAEIVFEKINKSVEERTYFYSLRPEDMKRLLEKPKVSKRSKELEGDEEKENQEDIDKAEDTTKMKEKERLLQRLRTAKLNAKYCFRRPGNLDYLRLIQQQFQINGHSIDYTKHPESHISDYI